MSSTTTTTTSTTVFKTGVQYGFFFDQSRCTGCHACSVACKSWNLVNAGPVKWNRHFEWETGTFPNLTINQLFAPCYHCATPVCVGVANGAMFKEPLYGAVLIDPNLATSGDLKTAWEMCPYGAIVFDSDAPNSNASKCTMCIDRLSQNLLPSCVLSCPQRALDFGPLSDLQATYGTKNQQLTGMPDPSATNPSVVFKPTLPMPQYVPYDASVALPLLAQRGTLPPFFTSTSDVTGAPQNIVGRNSLNMKAASTDELMETTRNDEG